MNEQKQKHTPGPWEVRPTSNAKNGTRWRDIVSTGAVYSPCYVGEAIDTDAELIAEAGTVATETGRTPRQLADDRAALLNACRLVSQSLGWGESVERLTQTEQAVILRDAIEKAGGAL